MLMVCRDTEAWCQYTHGTCDAAVVEEEVPLKVVVRREDMEGVVVHVALQVEVVAVAVRLLVTTGDARSVIEIRYC
jgi:hypothetical protein